MVGLALQHFLDQIVDDVPVIPREAGDEPGDVVASSPSTAPPAEARRSTLGAALKRCDILCRQPNPITPFRYAAASSGVKRRSAARISTSSPRPRKR